MRVIVTGVAGFIGSALARRLIENGHVVYGIDCFLESYPRQIKEDRVNSLIGLDNFFFSELDLASADLDVLVEGIDCVFHLAAQAGVRSSWGQRFEVYTRSNILSTQRLLEAVRNKDIKRFVYSSSSSVYGDAEILPTPEHAPMQPVSPYAVTKLAGEHLCQLYFQNFAVPTVALRYFTVYGPRPRPDQAVCIFTRAIMEDQEIEMYGDGEQLRGMTYVEDVVDANLLAAERDCVGDVFNIGGGSSITMKELVRELEELCGKKARVAYAERAKGDARNTLADIGRACEVLRWQPKVETIEGLTHTVASIKAFYY